MADAGLGKLDSRLLVLQGSPLEELPRVCKAWGIKRLAFEHCTEPYAKERDAQVRELCAALGVEVVTDIGAHTDHKRTNTRAIAVSKRRGEEEEEEKSHLGVCSGRFRDAKHEGSMS